MNRIFGLAPAWRELLREGEGAGGGGGEDTAGGAGGEDTTAGAGGADTVPGGAGGEGASTWWEDKRLADARPQLEAWGLTTDDPVDAVAKLSKMERDAQKKLGKSADQLMDRPAEGQDVGEWLRQNGELFGIPEAADKYELQKPEGWPKDAPWDDTLEQAARAKGHELGLSQSQMQGMTALYAEHVASLFGSAETDAAAANEALRTTLQKDWGGQYDAKVAQAQMAASAVAEAAGIDGDGLKALGDLLAGKTGDAQTIKLFAAIGDMMGEDTLQLSKGQGNTLGDTPADARAELQAMMAPDSDYAKAAAAKRAGRPSPDFDRLHKRYTQLTALAAKR
ncbi:hypothetical protein [Mameliella alba]|uniref:hypothetical protein n=1 Tax=Mameliella alba TaxID=561184 RepID=UPI000B52E903|nr:hypothetical protein [Mameliella alba]OWV39401.1 hypothetical protein CDZ95_26095 [Mameliella alba]